MKKLVSALFILAVVACGMQKEDLSWVQPPAGTTFAAPGQSSQAVAVACVTPITDCARPDYAVCTAVGGTATLVCTYDPCNTAATCPADRPVCDTTVGPVGTLAAGYCRQNTFDDTLPPGDASCLNNAACGAGVSCYVTAASSNGVCRTNGDPLPCIAVRVSLQQTLCGYTGVAFTGDPLCTDRKWRALGDGGTCTAF